MRGFLGVVAVVCFVSCSDGSEQPKYDEPEWSVKFESDAVDGWVRARSVAVRASDGSFIVAVTGGLIRIGEQMLEGSQLVRVSADGAVLDIEPLGCESPRLRTDDLGNVIVFCEGASMASYDANLDRSWTQPFEIDASAPFDVSPQGAIAVAPSDGVSGTSGKATIYWLASDGTMLWETTLSQILAIRFAANGDLFVFGGGHRWRYDSAGNVVDDIPVNSGTTLASPDGAWLYAKPMTQSSELDRYNSSGQLAWSRTYAGKLYSDHMMVSATGNIFVHAEDEPSSSALFEIDPATGDQRKVVSGCAYSRLVYADAEHCYGFGFHGFSKFALR